MFIHFPITFHRNEKRYEGKNVDLLFCCFHEPQKDVAGSVRSAEYSIVLHGTCIRVGYCDLRFGMNEILYYAGNIGYRIYFPYQGNHYAREAAGLLLNLAAEEYGMEQVLITCSPDNHASRKTLEQLHGRLIATTAVPETHWLYERGETVKNIYLFETKRKGRC